MIYLPKAMEYLRAGGKLKTYKGFRGRWWVSEPTGEFTILHELHPTAHSWLRAEGYGG